MRNVGSLDFLVPLVAHGGGGKGGRRRTGWEGRGGGRRRDADDVGMRGVLLRNGVVLLGRTGERWAVELTEGGRGGTARDAAAERLGCGVQKHRQGWDCIVGWELERQGRGTAGLLLPLLLLLLQRKGSRSCSGEGHSVLVHLTLEELERSCSVGSRIWLLRSRDWNCLMG